MSAFKDGGPAFPATTHNDGDRNAIDECGSALPPDWRQTYPGMTLRDYFAAKAMQADLSNWPIDAGDWLKHRADLVHRYYLMADAMLAERAKEQA